MKFVNFVKNAILITLIVLTIVDGRKHRSKLRKVNKVAMWSCPSGQFAVSITVWGGYNDGKDYASDVDRECLDPTKGTININIKGHYVNVGILDYRWQEAYTSEYKLKEEICKNYSLFKSYTLSASRLVFCKKQNPGDYKQLGFEDHIIVITAGTGNSDNLKSFYDSLSADCKKPLTINNSSIA
jgi:hypothetical protein